MLDEQLRDELASWADGAGRLRVPDVSLLRRRARRRRARLTVTCAGLAAAAVALAVSLPAVLHQAGRPTGLGTDWRPAGKPPPPDAGISAEPYFVTLSLELADEPAVVRDALTGRLIATIPAPAAIDPTGFQAVSAAADDRTFVLAGETRPRSRVQLYELQLGRGGRPRPVVRLRPLLPSNALTFALSPDGSKLAVAVSSGTAIEVITLATGQRRLWRPAGRRHVTGMAWAGADELAVTWYRIASPLAKTVGPSGGLGLLPVGTAGGSQPASLAEIRLLISARVAYGRFHGIVNPLVSADGSVIYGTMTSNGPSRQAEVVEFSGSTGKPLRAVSPATGESGMGDWCGAVWADPSGQQAAIACASLGLGEGVAIHGRFTHRDLHLPIYNESVPTASFIAW
jgi:hypothetical protein